MQDLSIENLSRVYGPNGQSVTASETATVREMKAQGMPEPKVDLSGAATTFSEILRDSVDKVNEFQLEADKSIKELVAGRSKNIHETMLTIERADSSLKLMMQVRNKILDAYREIMRMQV